MVAVDNIAVVAVVGDVVAVCRCYFDGPCLACRGRGKCVVLLFDRQTLAAAAAIAAAIIP